jgi:Flp pilus assembly protein TadB
MAIQFLSESFKMFNHADTAVFFFLAVASIALFTFLAVASWSGARSEERKSYYKNDMLKKLAESPEAGAAATLEYLREQQRNAARKQRGGMQLGGMITAAVGLGFGIFLAGIVPDHTPVYLLGLIPLLIGFVLFLYAHYMMPVE